MITFKHTTNTNTLTKEEIEIFNFKCNEIFLNDEIDELTDEVTELKDELALLKTTNDYQNKYIGVLLDRNSALNEENDTFKHTMDLMVNKYKEDDQTIRDLNERNKHQKMENFELETLLWETNYKLKHNINEIGVR